jgi:hypothetical protein
MEGRAGAALGASRSLEDRPATWGGGARRARAGFDAVWMATTDLGYLDRRLWDDAGTVEGGPWMSTRGPWGDGTLFARVAARGGVVYWQPGPGVLSRERYDVEPFLRATAEAWVRKPGPLGTVLGARLFAGGYLGRSAPPRQRRILVAGADPYETFTNPGLRSRGALLVRPGVHYHAPGGANLRGFRPDLGGRWAVSGNFELTKPVWRRGGGPLREAALAWFADGGVVDSAAFPSSPPGRWYTTLYDGGVSLVTRHAVGDMEWTMRFELPLVVNRWTAAADVVPDARRLAFRWQVSLEPSF